MTEVVSYQPGQIEPVHYAPRQMRLVEWAEEARAANGLAQALCKTAFAGAYRDNPDGATAAILKGAEVGLTPVTSLGAFDLIQGTPAPKAITLRALVQSRGHAVWIESSTDTLCVAKARRRGESEVHTSTWTIARARAMDLTTKKNWKTQPGAMLIARATSEVCRMVAADVILGIGYSAEEMLDLTPEPTVRASRARPERPVMPEPGMDPPTPITARRGLPAPPEPDFDDTPQADGGVDSPAATSVAEGEAGSSPAGNTLPPSDLIDPAGAQMKALHASMNEAGLGDRDAGLRYIGDLLGHDVGSSKELSVREASRVIDAVKALAEHPLAADEPPLPDTEEPPWQ